MKIITLCREYGAGGHSIGQRVAKELGIEFYDKDIIRKSAEALGIDPAQLAAEEEEISRSEAFLRTITPMSYERKDSLFEVESEVILKLAAHGPCFILGRCADTVLRGAGVPSLNIFLFADEEHRAKRVGELIHSSNASEIQRVMKKTDQARRSYYTHYTGKAWGDHRNFHLSLDSGTLGYDACVRIICEAARSEG
jgi:cytidylate kinase